MPSPTRPSLACAALAAAVSLVAWDAPAQQTAPSTSQPDVTTSLCYAFADAGPRIIRANVQPQGLAEDEVGLTFIGHSTFLIEASDGVTVATDFAGYAGPGVIPEVVTMNHAHETHYTNFPDPAIEHVLRGWNPEGGPAKHDLEVGEVRIRNVPTDIRGWGAEEPDGNSIFIFEVADLCIGHLGHLHHVPTLEDFAEIGFLDVVLAPVDGVYTMSQSEMIDTLKKLRARLVVPMHAFGNATLAQFIDGMRDEFAIDVRDTHTVVLSEATLPSEPTVLAIRAYLPYRDD